MQLMEILLLPALFLTLSQQQQEDLLMAAGIISQTLLERFDKTATANSEFIIYESESYAVGVSKHKIRAGIRR